MDGLIETDRDHLSEVRACRRPGTQGRGRERGTGGRERVGRECTDVKAVHAHLATERLGRHDGARVVLRCEVCFVVFFVPVASFASFIALLASLAFLVFVDAVGNGSSPTAHTDVRSSFCLLVRRPVQQRVTASEIPEGSGGAERVCLTVRVPSTTHGSTATAPRRRRARTCDQPPINNKGPKQQRTPARRKQQQLHCCSSQRLSLTKSAACRT